MGNGMEHTTSTPKKFSPTFLENETRLDARPLTIEKLPEWRNRVTSRTREPRFPTGITGLDSLLWGVHPGELMIIGARPSQGKTSLACQMAWNLASKTDAFVLYFSLEMSSESVIERLFCLDQKVSGYKLRTGIIPSDFEKKYEHFKDRMMIAKLEIFDNIGWTRDQIGDALEWALGPKGATNPIVFIDHVQMCSSKGYSSKQEALADYIRGLNEFATKYNASVIATSQISRAGSGDESMDYLKGSGELEEAASTIVNCRWCVRCTGKEIYSSDPKKYICDVVKQRHGPTDRVIVSYEADTFTFGEYQEQDFRVPPPWGGLPV